MDYTSLTDAELRRLLASSTDFNEGLIRETVKRFIDQDEMYTQDELDEAKEEARAVGYDNGYAEGYCEGEGL